MSPTRETGFFGVSGMSSGSVLPAVAASGNTSSNEKMSRSSSPASASGRRSVSQDVSSDSPVVDHAEGARLASRDGDHRRRRQPEREGSASRAIARGPRPYQAEDLSRIYGRRVVRVSWRPIIRIAGR